MLACRGGGYIKPNLAYKLRLSYPFTFSLKFKSAGMRSSFRLDFYIVDFADMYYFDISGAF